MNGWLALSIICFHSYFSDCHDGKSFSQTETEVSKLLEGLLDRRYNKNLRPGYGEHPVIVNISMEIMDISSISETDMDFQVDFYIRHVWQDHRLGFENHTVKEITLGDEFAKKIWVPGSYFVNGESLKIHKSVFDEPTTLLRIKADGEILYSTRIILTAQCSMDLKFFPMDQQKCSIEMESFGLSTDEAEFRWFDDDGKAVEFEEISLPTFNLIGFNKGQSIKKYWTGNFSRLHVDFYLTRSFGFYVSQVYVPAFLIVVISWIPFFLSRDSHARVALGVTTCLTITTLITNTSEGFPKISHLKAIDIYLFVSFIMVFLSLIEYAIVGYYEYVISKTKDKREEDKNGNAKPDPDASLPIAQRLRSFQNTSTIDWFSRYIFPAVFISFNISYGLIMYTLVSCYHEDPDHILDGHHH